MHSGAYCGASGALWKAERAEKAEADATWREAEKAHRRERNARIAHEGWQAGEPVGETIRKIDEADEADEAEHRRLDPVRVAQAVADNAREHEARVAAYADRVVMVRDGQVSGDLGAVGEQLADARASTAHTRVISAGAGQKAQQ